MTENERHTCYQEARITALETKLETKKEQLNGIDEDYYHLSEQLSKISLNLATISATMDTLIDNRKETNDKILDLQLEMKELKTNWQNIKWLIGVGVPVLTTVLTIVANYLL